MPVLYQQKITNKLKIDKLHIKKETTFCPDSNRKNFRDFPALASTITTILKL